MQYIRAHWVSHTTALQRRLTNNQAAAAAAPQPYKPINTSATAVEELMAAVATDAKLAEAFVQTRWPLLDRLSEQHLVSLILELIRAMPGEERWGFRVHVYLVSSHSILSV